MFCKTCRNTCFIRTEAKTITKAVHTYSQVTGDNTRLEYLTSTIGGNDACGECAARSEIEYVHYLENDKGEYHDQQTIPNKPDEVAESLDGGEGEPPEAERYIYYVGKANP